MKNWALRLGGILMVLAIAGGCSGRRELDMIGRQELENAIASRGVTPTHVVVPYALTAEMKRWIGERVSGNLVDPKERLFDLSRALLDTGGLQIEYAKGHTGTASEVFQAREANCLAFTHMFVGMARHLDIPAYFLEVRNVESYRREGDLIVVSDHVAVGHGPVHDLTVIDFGATQQRDARRIRIIDDYRAIAMFYSNRGAEQLRKGLYDDALNWLRSAVAVDPVYDAAWVNLGVAMRRSGNSEGAEMAYRTALEIDINSSSAVQNLASLLSQQGQAEEAMELLALADRQQNRNPFTYLSLGDLSMKHGSHASAGRYYRKALRRQGENAESMAAIGLWHLRAGERRKAGNWLRRAEVLDPSSDRVSTLKQSLAAESPS